MKKTDDNQALPASGPDTAPVSGVAADDAAHAKEAQRSHSRPGKRTPGLKLVDVVLYPILTNFGVFAISVAATYLTKRGGDRNAEGKLIFGKVGEWFQKRGEKLTQKLQSFGMTEGQADMSKMVAFSFIDGSAMAPAVKLLEDRREEFGRCIDNRLGTTPEDMSVYQAEPKQTWLSVLGGRFATASIVVPTAVALDKTGLNDVLFTKPGARAGEWLAKKPFIAKRMGRLDVKELSKIGFFEFFYTSVCTAGLYFSSRCLARLTGSDHSKETPLASGNAGFCAPRDAKAEIRQEAAEAPERTHAHEGLKRSRPEARSSSGYVKNHANEPKGQPSFLGV